MRGLIGLSILSVSASPGATDINVFCRLSVKLW